jgi:type VI secretion system secreted protein VgrG
MYTEEGINYYEHVNVKESDYKKGLDRVGETKEIADAVNLTELSGVSNNGFLSAGMQVKISCLKQNKNEKQDYGKYLLTSVNHQMDSNFFYENIFTAIPAETSLPENTNPMIIKTSSNQQAYVTDNKDPNKLGRIKVRFWWMKRGQSTPWLKVLTPYSHLKAGIYFVPALNSRVLVGFEDDDVEKPYCIGTLYDEAVTPDPDWVGNANEGDAKIHAIRTASGNTIEFHDSEGGEKITLYDKDDKNRITLDSANRTLTIHADGTLNINASKINIKAEKEFTLICEKSDTTVTKDMNMTVGNNLSIDAGRNFSLASGSDNTISAGKKLKREAVEVEISALGSLKSTAKGKAEFTATGITVIKGSLVQIN